MNPTEIVRNAPRSVKSVEEVSRRKYYGYCGTSNLSGTYYIGVIIYEGLEEGWNAPSLFNADVCGSSYLPSLQEKIEDLFDKGFCVFEFNTELDRARWIVSQIEKQ